jgi:hypothetical protein
MDWQVVFVSSPSEFGRKSRNKSTSPRVLAILITFAVLLSVVSALVGSRFSTTNQIAARSTPPPSSLITVPLQYGHLVASVSMRANVSVSDPVLVAVPDDLGSDLAVVTTLSVTNGSSVSEGQVLLSVAESPVFVLQGSIPAFRDMAAGDSGVDIAELQSSLHRIGLSTGTDPIGAFGAGTALAVSKLYATRGYQSPSQTTSKGKAFVPLGEVVFVPRLPVSVTSLNVRLGGLARAGDPLMTLSSGTVALSGVTDAVSAAALRVGDSCLVTSDSNGATFRATVTSVSKIASSSQVVAGSGAPGFPLSMAPIGQINSGFVGQNVSVQIQTRTTSAKTWIVPITAVYTRANGTSFVTVVTRRSRTTVVAVSPGLVTGGQEAVTVVSGRLRVGEPVVVGANNGA